MRKEVTNSAEPGPEGPLKVTVMGAMLGGLEWVERIALQCTTSILKALRLGLRAIGCAAAS